MFCGNCGTKNDDSAEFCANCGAKLIKSTPAPAPAAAPGAVAVPAQSQNAQYRKVGIIAVVVAAVIIVILGIFLFKGRDSKATIDKFVDAQYHADVKAIVNLIPKKVIDYSLEQSGYDKDDLDDFLDDLEDTLDSQMDTLDTYLGKGWKVSYDILGDETIQGGDLDNIQEEYEDMDVNVSAAKDMTVEITISTKNNDETTAMTVPLIKVGRSWYLDVFNMDSLF